MFKTGDRVRCVRPDAAVLAAGNEYEIESEEGDYVWLKGVAGAWLSSRFVLISPAATPDSVAPTFPVNHCQLCGVKRQDFGVVCESCFMERRFAALRS